MRESTNYIFYNFIMLHQQPAKRCCLDLCNIYNEFGQMVLWFRFGIIATADFFSETEVFRVAVGCNRVTV